MTFSVPSPPSILPCLNLEGFFNEIGHEKENSKFSEKELMLNSDAKFVDFGSKVHTLRPGLEDMTLRIDKGAGILESQHKLNEKGIQVLI